MTDPRVPDLSTVESPLLQSDIEYDMVKDGQVIGRGGQAVVRRISLSGQKPPDTVAVKEPLAPSESLDQTRVKSFFEEARTWQTLARREREQPFRNTDHIVGIVAIGDELPWVAIEYMDGGSLADRLGSHPDGLPIDEALWIAECLCRGLKIAHDHGVAHLDLKPANVLFRETPGDAWDVPKIADWGLSQVLIEASGSMDAYSVEYAAPEQFDSDKFGKPDTYTDIYQLGALMYVLLTGRPPYRGSHTSIMFDVVYGDDPDPPSVHRGAVPSVLDEVVLQSLSTNKGNRFRGSVERLEDILHTLQTRDSMSNIRTESLSQTDLTNEIESSEQIEGGTEDLSSEAEGHKDDLKNPLPAVIRKLTDPQINQQNGRTNPPLKRQNR